MRWKHYAVIREIPSHRPVLLEHTNTCCFVSCPSFTYATPPFSFRPPASVYLKNFVPLRWDTTTTDLNIKTGSSILWFLELDIWSQLLRLSFGFPIWLPKKLHWLDCLLTIASRFFRLELIIHNIPIIIKEKGTSQWNLDLLNWASQYGRQGFHFRTSDAQSSLYFEISDHNQEISLDWDETLSMQTEDEKHKSLYWKVKSYPKAQGLAVSMVLSI